MLNTLAVSHFSFGKRFCKHVKTWPHHRQVNQVAIEHTFIRPAVGIREQFACKQVNNTQRGNPAHYISRFGHLKLYPAFQHNFKFDVVLAQSNCSANAVLVCTHFSKLRNQSGVFIEKPQHVSRFPHQCTQGPVAGKVRHHQIDVH
ncbi:MAG: hypothetical protein A0129_07295 [Limnobacter sp. CACIAM 66H1]|nr:MAG: hypothetical protein A0129_07295 [Limnobacter sp. CACIAM 66H1]